MRAFSVVATIFLLTGWVSALPVFGFGAGNGCLTKNTAYDLVKNFIKLTNGDGFNETLADALIVDNVIDTSGSVASVINMGNSTAAHSWNVADLIANCDVPEPGGTGPVPLLGPTIANKTQFIESNSAQAPTPYKPLNIYWTCDVVTFRFEIPFKPQPILGITILETIPAPKGSEFPFQIKQVWHAIN